MGNVGSQLRARWLIAACALAAAVSASAWVGAPAVAWADDLSAATIEQNAATAEQGAATSKYASLSLDELKALVETRTAELADLQVRKGHLVSQLYANGLRLTLVDKRLPILQESAEAATVERYKLQRHGMPVIDMLLRSESLEVFMDRLQYIEAASSVGVDEVVRLREEKQRFEQEKEQLELDNATIDQQIAQVAADLDGATKARDEAQRRADMVASVRLAPDGIDWNAGEERFLQEWTARIDAYLAGSPLEGQGKVFAKAAWDNIVDPRFSPAISTIESSTGRICIRPHNAWGWGAADSDPYNLASEWATWEQAINAHVQGLAKGYGYTVTQAGAQKYCPYTWESWYVGVVNEMNRM